MRSEEEIREQWLQDFTYTQDGEGRQRDLLRIDPVRLGWIQALEWVLNDKGEK